MNRSFAEFDQMIEQRNVMGHLIINEAEEEVNKVENFLVKQKK